MGKILLLSFMALCTFTGSPGRGDVSDADWRLLTHLNRIINLPEGDHRIYNGEGNTVFDILYTIEAEKNKWSIYEGRHKISFDLLYTIVKDKNEYKVYKGRPVFSSDLIYTVKTTRKGFEVYKGSSVFSSNLVYTYERK